MSELTDELFDRYVIDGDDDEVPSIVECKRCGKGGLHWEETDEGWRLYDHRMKKHTCSSVASLDDFDVV